MGLMEFRNNIFNPIYQSGDKTAPDINPKYGQMHWPCPDYYNKTKSLQIWPKETKERETKKGDKRERQKKDKRERLKKDKRETMDRQYRWTIKMNNTYRRTI